MQALGAPGVRCAAGGAAARPRRVVAAAVQSPRCAVAAAAAAHAQPPPHALQLRAPRRSARAAARRAKTRADASSAPQSGGGASSSGDMPSQPPLKWSFGTVIENKPASADGSMRTLVLSVQDEWRQLELMRGATRARQEGPRWADAFTRPGQFVALRPDGAPPPAPDASRRSVLKASLLVPIASSPYATRRDSAFLDAAIIELLVDQSPEFALKGADSSATSPNHLAALTPGTQLSVSEPLGAGFASLLSADVALSTALEERRALLLLGGAGARGAGPLRAALEWQPVAALAGIKGVTLFLSAPRAAAAPYVADWDRWREAGVRIHACFDDDDVAPGAQKGTSGLEEALLRGGRRMAEVCGAPPGECAVLVAALPAEVRGRVTRELVAAGFSNERILFCEPY